MPVVYDRTAVLHDQMICLIDCSRDTRQEDVEGSPTQSHISPSIRRILIRIRGLVGLATDSRQLTYQKGVRKVINFDHPEKDEPFQVNRVKRT